MQIDQVELVSCAVRTSQYPEEGLPEFLLVGRSNVGKSSFINTLINRKNFAHTSSKPGKTQTLNFYLINKSFYFVDVPGYGYAAVSHERQKKYYNLKIKIVATKYDKVSKNSREKQNKLIKDTLKLPEGEEFIPFSTVYKTGRDEVYEVIKELL